MSRLDSLRYLWSPELLAWTLQGQLGSWASLSMSAVGLGVWLESLGSQSVVPRPPAAVSPGHSGS